MPNSSRLEQLFARYEDLARNALHPSEDERRSVNLYRTEQRIVHREPKFERAAERDDAWVRSLLALEAFAAREGRLPRENNRAPAESSAPDEIRLANWVRSERRAGAAGRRCNYQLDRLTTVPGFRWYPLDARWLERLAEYRGFTTISGAAPRLRGGDQNERSLARWAAKQRFLRRDRRLPKERITLLNELDFWAWGSAAPAG